MTAPNESHHLASEFGAELLTLCCSTAVSVSHLRPKQIPIVLPSVVPILPNVADVDHSQTNDFQPTKWI